MVLPYSQLLCTGKHCQPGQHGGIPQGSCLRQRYSHVVHLKVANPKLQHRLVQVENSLQRKGADKLILQHCMQQQMHTAAAMHVVVTLVVRRAAHASVACATHSMQCTASIKPAAARCMTHSKKQGSVVTALTAVPLACCLSHICQIVGLASTRHVGANMQDDAMQAVDSCPISPGEPGQVQDCCKRHLQHTRCSHLCCLSLDKQQR